MITRLAGPGDPRIAAYRDIAEAERIRSKGLFVAEGRLIVRRLIEQGRYAVRSVLVSDAARRSLDPVLRSLSPDVPVYVCEAADFLGITGHDIHRGCLALVERPAPRTVGDLLASPAAQHVTAPSCGTGLKTCVAFVILEGVTNADNVGGVFRNAAAFGVGGVLLSPTSCDPLYRKAIRTSMAATLRVPYARHEQWPAGLDDVRAAGFAIVALTPRQPSVPLDAVAARRPSKIALLVGTEGDGLSAGAEARADVRVRIPISPDVDSLNLAVAVGIALHALQERPHDPRSRA